MGSKTVTVLLVSALSAGWSVTSAKAADVASTPECGVAGVVDGGVGYEGGNVSGPINKSLHGMFMGYGETAMGYGCANWMAQIDGAFYHDGFSGTVNTQNYDISGNKGHLGGALFWRDASEGRLGLAASEIFNNTHISVTSSPGEDIGGSLTRVGAFGDYYASDAVTVGAGGFYVAGIPFSAGSSGLSQSGFEGNLHAIFYVQDNISLGLQGDLQLANITSSGTAHAWNGYGISADAEYLIPDTAVSLFVGGRYASRTLDDVSANVTFNDAQGFVGVKWAFGGPVSSLRARDRSGTYDNTSVFNEKLPSLFTDDINAELP
ncbi:MAG: hypothetical protein KGO53_12455 [Alphaproteobacteria bacterium]|nr:hypothetical protein [Alphaproteobacteria bacterium]